MKNFMLSPTGCALVGGEVGSLQMHILSPTLMHLQTASWRRLKFAQSTSAVDGDCEILCQAFHRRVVRVMRVTSGLLILDGVIFEG